MVSRAELGKPTAEEALTQGLDPQMNLGQLRTQGWRTHDVLRDDLMVTAIRFEGDQGAEYWVGLPNFYVITRYNRSAMYAMAVHQLAGEIARARGVH
ncbi:Membrane-bound lytic murein transglycosylase B [compost metagenome]